MEKSQLLLYGLGFVAQGIFGMRLLVQLFLAEKAGKIVSPTIFWYLSLIASALFLLYGILRNDVVIIFGQFFSFYIYVRNLQLKKVWSDLPLVIRGFGIILPLLLLLLVKWDSVRISVTTGLTLLFWVGAVGQLLLNLRFVYQWIYSEKQKDSSLPLGFWIISFVASIMVIIYAWSKKDPVLLVAQGMGIVVYTRNIMIGMKNGSVRATD